MSTFVLKTGALAVVLALTACTPPPPGSNQRQPESQALLPTTELCLRDGENAAAIEVEVADDFHERRVGLMGRTELAANSGMLFIYERQREGNRGFWMRDTLLPLDIAYLDQEGEIVAIQQMEPCNDPYGNCPTYVPGVAYWMALEMNANFFREQGIGVGAKILALPAEECQPVARPANP